MVHGYSPKLLKAFFSRDILSQYGLDNTVGICIHHSSLEENNILKRIHKSGEYHPFGSVTLNSVRAK